jgi:hypothetical protein
MMTVVLAVAVVGVALLAAAVLTGSTIVALVVIVIAVVGLVLLARDWLEDRRHLDTEPSEPQEQANKISGSDVTEAEHASAETPLEPDEFEPDVPYDESDTGAEDAEDIRETEHHGAEDDTN